MVFWAPGAFFVLFRATPPYTIEVEVPIRRLKILAKFALALELSPRRTAHCGCGCEPAAPPRRQQNDHGPVEPST